MDTGSPNGSNRRLLMDWVKIGESKKQNQMPIFPKSNLDSSSCCFIRETKISFACGIYFELSKEFPSLFVFKVVIHNDEVVANVVFWVGRSVSDPLALGVLEFQFDAHLARLEPGLVDEPQLRLPESRSEFELPQSVVVLAAEVGPLRVIRAERLKTKRTWTNATFIQVWIPESETFKLMRRQL